jgi:hypothetical protein
MITDEMIDKYNEYLHKHINAVKTAFDWLLVNFPELFKDYDADVLGAVISSHDMSKWDDEEYFAYCEYFYGEHKDEDWVQTDFDYAWLHHQHNNPHHWQHWLLREDDGGNKPLEMDYLYVIEMICDHWAFSWVKGDLYEIFNWYEKNKSKMVLHPNTKQLYESILDKIKEKLDETNPEN